MLLWWWLRRPTRARGAGRCVSPNLTGASRVSLFFRFHKVAALLAELLAAVAHGDAAAGRRPGGSLSAQRRRKSASAT